MPSTVVLPSGLIGPGTFAFGPVTIPAGLTVLQIAVTRTNILSTTAGIAWQLELSRDGGVTFKAWIGESTIGGARTDRFTGLPVTDDLLRAELPPGSDGTWQVRGSITVNEVVTTAVTLTVT